MICPHCHESHTPEEPCSCPPPLRAPSFQPGPLHVSGDGADGEPSSTLGPTGLDNPFWKA
jgi:hypothetical protein